MRDQGYYARVQHFGQPRQNVSLHGLASFLYVCNGRSGQADGSRQPILGVVCSLPRLFDLETERLIKRTFRSCHGMLFTPDGGDCQR